MTLTLTPGDFVYFGKCLEGFLFGLYSAIFAMYLQHHASKKDGDKGKNILFYTLCALYLLSTATIMLDAASYVIGDQNIITLYRLVIVQAIVFACCDFIAQSILIYRCWIVWRGNIRVVIIPAILAFAFLVIWIAGSIRSVSIVQGQFSTAIWGINLAMGDLAVSITVNALVTGLIVFRILKVFRGVKNLTSGSTLRPIIFVVIESGVALFSIQLVRLIITPLMSDAADKAYELIVAIHQMFNGITPTIILVRVSMGLSFHDENSMVEAAGSLHFAADNSNSTFETESIINQEPEGDDDLQVIIR